MFELPLFLTTGGLRGFHALLTTLRLLEALVQSCRTLLDVFQGCVQLIRTNAGRRVELGAFLHPDGPRLLELANRRVEDRLSRLQLGQATLDFSTLLVEFGATGIEPLPLLLNGRFLGSDLLRANALAFVLSIKVCLARLEFGFPRVCFLRRSQERCGVSIDGRAPFIEGLRLRLQLRHPGAQFRGTPFRLLLNPRNTVGPLS